MTRWEAIDKTARLLFSYDKMFIESSFLVATNHSCATNLKVENQTLRTFARKGCSSSGSTSTFSLSLRHTLVFNFLGVQPMELQLSYFYLMVDQEAIICWVLSLAHLSFYLLELFNIVILLCQAVPQPAFLLWSQFISDLLVLLELCWIDWPFAASLHLIGSSDMTMDSSFSVDINILSVSAVVGNLYGILCRFGPTILRRTHSTIFSIILVSFCIFLRFILHSV